MHPEIDIGPLTLQTFGIMFALGFVGAGVLVAKRLAELGRSPDLAYELIFGALIGGLVGARVYYMVQHWGTVHHDLLGNLFSGEGLVWYGGAIGGAIGVAAVAHYRGLLGIGLLDLTAPALALGYAIGRIGCQLSGDGDYGTPSSVPWAMSYPHGTVPTTERVHPTPIYEMLAMAFVAWLLWRWRDRFRPGMLFAIYLTLAGLERFLVEFIRRNEELLAGLTMPQLQSLVLIAAGVVWIAVATRGRTAALAASTRR
jgi:phosphatidylglycerol---prolipoprotein diacylglyceryl transferase